MRKYMLMAVLVMTTAMGFAQEQQQEVKPRVKGEMKFDL